MSGANPYITGLASEEQAVLNALLDQWRAKKHINLTRSHYYDAKHAVKNLGIAVPPYLQKLDIVLGWPAKAVDALALRVNHEGFVVPTSRELTAEVEDIADLNAFDIESASAQVAALIHSLAFIFVSLGDEEAGEPDVVVAFRDALSATGLYDPRKRALSSALAIIETSESGEPTEMNLYTPEEVIILRQNANGVWDRPDRRPHGLGYVPVVPLVFKPRLGRPFGTSRITRPIMSITDSAMRTVLRSEVGAEFYAGPQRVLLGADESAFMDQDGNLKSQWEAIIGRIWAIPMGEDANGDPVRPDVKQMPQVSMQPHTDHLRMFAAMFAGEAGLPLDELGIVQDNPSSAEAIYAAKESLLVEAEHAQTTFGRAYDRALRIALELRLDRTIEDRVRSKWRDASTPSRAQATDAVTKQIAAGVLDPQDEVTWELLGYDETTIERLKAAQRRRRAEAIGTLAERAEAARQESPIVADFASRRTEDDTPPSPPTPPSGSSPTPPQPSDDGGNAPAAQKSAEDEKEAAAVLKAKFEALGMAVRAGVDPETAAQMLGLEGIKFTGAVPVSLRMPESKAQGLEEA